MKLNLIGRRRLHLLYTDYEDMPLSRIIRIWEYFVILGMVGYGGLWIVSKILL